MRGNGGRYDISCWDGTGPFHDTNTMLFSFSFFLAVRIPFRLSEAQGTRLTWVYRGQILGVKDGNPEIFIMKKIRKIFAIRKVFFRTKIRKR